MINPNLWCLVPEKMQPKLHDITLSLLGKYLLPSKTAKDLGVLWVHHLSYNIQIIKTVLQSMFSVSGSLNTPNILYILVFSNFFFNCSNVRANCAKLDIDKLKLVQNLACRMVNGIRKYDHVTPELKRFRWLQVSSQRYYRSAILAFKGIYGRPPEYLSTFFHETL